METHVRLEPWSAGDFWLLERKNEPIMTQFLGGPEPAAKLVDRQRRYEAMSAREPAAGRMFRVVWTPAGQGPEDGGRPDGHQGGRPDDGRRAESVGSVGFWEREWQGEPVYESGWGILPEFQGHGLAVAALTELLAYVRAHGSRDSVHAFPGTDHPASNAVCRRAGFEYLGDVDFEYPPGVPHPSCDWRYRVERPRAGLTPSG
ncbi:MULTISPECIES: GNAT family N-acetyltransferase [unclassified Streptomyces]|uniref:GNAT family N-acetyltransferase n=1 Tax=unclassified Streptomyces TaxID=2593676 RepID=UPI0004BD6BB2|nr:MULTISPECIES: GNAT family N-acetyltransferase [unclassified Streptomyces]